MALRMMSPLPARVIQVLKDFLPAEMTLIDAEEADGITTPTIAALDYFEWDQGTIRSFPACSLRLVSSRPHAEDFTEIRPDSLGKRASVLHRMDVMFHVTKGDTSGDSLELQRLLTRYINGAMRVLCIMKYELPTTADPTAFVAWTKWVGEATYGPEEAQDEGAIVRTAILPVEIWTIEARG